MSKWILIKNWIWNRTIRLYYMWKWRNSRWFTFLTTKKIDSTAEDEKFEFRFKQAFKQYIFNHPFSKKKNSSF